MAGEATPGAPPQLPFDGCGEPKVRRDAGEWTPARHGAWFAERVIAVKLEYELSVD